ncbi:pyridoxal phosphate-dependent decarboxylase family protein [Vibrio quintilis]|uniref:L-2,4-diaminobutyrate decarboxylase n=1 Tax=Vibrio quintilis TaxID=1117707 RepID=A0A1M7Z068_9VIBR|nr:pyridoxal-dependent decarboxylase [Vibrio quintilis]SHO58244.1 L-2,4-diaminobutyrate decarboxylase [Vibrio quintilis]
MNEVMLCTTNDLAANQLSPEFLNHYQAVISRFFSRDPEIWPVYQSQDIHDLTHHKVSFSGSQQHDFNHQLNHRTDIPHHMSTHTGPFDPLALYVAHGCKDWQDPKAVENVISTPCDPAIQGATLATITNPNLVYKEYAGLATDLEQLVVRQIAELAGYNPEQASGLFTQGGTFCNLYGYLLGLRKTFPDSIVKGLKGKQLCMLNSESGHYSNMTNLTLLGLDMKNQVIRVHINEQNQICLRDLKRRLENCFKNGIHVPTIMLTFGTTDTFAIDDIKQVYLLREEICRKYRITRKPHLHVDAAVGWSLLFFRHYDLNKNPLSINQATLSSLNALKPLMKGIRYADSFTVDFQKWGYVPYTSSLLMIKNKQDLEALKQDASYFTYFEHEVQKKTHLQSTIECSRGANGVFAAYSALQFMGVEGYQTIIAHGLQNANYMRAKLNEHPHCKVVCAENHGPSVVFRLYPDTALQKEDSNHLFLSEQHITVGKHSIDDLIQTTLYHRNHFNDRKGKHLKTNWVESIARTTYDKNDHCLYLPGEKAVFLNPYTTRTDIDKFCNQF